MPGVKKASVAGQFYTADREALASQIREFDGKRKKDRPIKSRLVVAPHAGYIYSGQLMSESIGYLADDVKTIFVVAPAHRVPFIGLALSNYDCWETPLGKIPLDREINESLVHDFSCAYLDDAFAPEHAAEVEVPFIQSRFPEGVRIVPVLVGRVVTNKITSLLERYYDDPANAFVISSDLSHFLTSDKAKKMDADTARMIESGDCSRFRQDQACGAVGILGAVTFARNRGFSLLRAGMFNSGDVTGERDRVVGYGSWFLYEGSKERCFKQYYSDLILKTVRDTIAASLKSGNRKPTRDMFDNIPASFEEWGACFVTLELDGNLRGCIGSIAAHSPFIDDLVSNSWSAAFADPRFRPLDASEFPRLKISVSLLSAPVPLQFNNEQEMKDQIKPFEHGVIISDQYNRAVYLPSVWKQIPDKDQFLRQLKIKAGMSPNHFSPTFQASIYTTEYITEEEYTGST